MITSYDKAIAAFLTSLIGVLAMFNVSAEWINPTTIGAITPFIAMVVTWLVPNKVDAPPAPPSVGPGV